MANCLLMCLRNRGQDDEIEKSTCKPGPVSVQVLHAFYKNKSQLLTFIVDLTNNSSLMVSSKIVNRMIIGSYKCHKNIK